MINAPGFIYFAQLESGGPIKLGFSNNPERRITYFPLPEPLVILAKTPGFRVQEKRLHRQIEAYRHRGEWYRDCEEIRAFMAETIAEVAA